MSVFTFGLVVAAAFIHATWNLLAKQASGKATFLWLVAVSSATMYGPLVVAFILWRHPKLNGIEFFFISGSAFIHFAYFLILQKGYRVADLSIIYPLARGTAPILSTLGAIAIFGERPSSTALFGILLIVIGILILTSGGYQSLQALNKGRFFGMPTGVTIAAYTLWDKRAVSVVMLSPLILDYGSTLARVIFLMPVAFRKQKEVRAEWRKHRSQVLGVAFFNPLSFILVLIALIHSPVSYIAPARELSILFGVVLGGRLLSETDTSKRLFASILMLGGIAALTLG
jgi:drug/metabolite transporter (DMT)-like permease